MKPRLLLSLVTALATTSSEVDAADPRTNSWITGLSGRYARIYANDAALGSGASVTTWSNGTQNQALPAYAGVQEIYSSTDWVYLRTSGLALHVMGPWLNGQFPNLPANQKAFYRIPRSPSVPTTKTQTGLGTIGYFVDGVAMFDSRDGFVWTGAAEAGNGTGYWQREAYVNEGATFDPGYAHQENTGNHHYHANPVALRYLLGDHVEFNSATKTYSESAAAVTRHSPILGWVRDGFPIYGPFGYSIASNSSSGLRRMVSAYQLRNGQRGSDNLTTSGRTTIPAWAQRAYGVAASQSGPAVSTTYPLGRYMEDNVYLGDLNNPNTGTPFVLGTDFDLDEYNGRWCITPEFPNGTYAYFTSIAANGTPVFPYNIGRSYYGSPVGAAVTALAETVATNFIGGADSAPTITTPTISAGSLTLVWNGAEGGTYQVESTTNFSNWTTNLAGILPTRNIGSFTNMVTAPAKFFRIHQTAIAPYDPATGTTGGTGGGGATPGPPLASVSPTVGNRGTTVSITMALGANPPPANILPISATLGTINGSNVQRSGNNVTASFIIPANANAGPATVSVVFPGPPGMGNVSFSLVNGCTIQ